MQIRRPGLQLAILGFVAFVTSFGAHVVAVNLPVYAKQVGAGAFMIGLLIAVYDFAELGAKPVFGFVADPRGMKVTMLAGIAVFSIASLSPDRRGRAVGVYNAIKGAGYVISPVVGGAIVWASNFSMIFPACFAIGAVGEASSDEEVELEAASGLEPEIEVLQGKRKVQTNRLQTL